MLSSDRSEHRADHPADYRANHRRRAAARAWNNAPWDDAQSFDPNAPWDDAAAEALMCLHESEEGRLWRPAVGDRARPSLPPTGDGVGEAAEGVDRAWLEAHLKGLAQRLQDALAQANPERTLAALTGRLETIEQRFGATLGRVAQRADLDGLRAIETRVLELAGQLEQARERLDRVGAVDEEVRALARKVEEAAGVQRTSGLEKLLRDCIAEWREGEQRTASALQHIEEAIGRLGEAMDAMEAAKPAPDLAVPPLTGADLGVVGAGNGSLQRAEEGPLSALPLYPATLDAADYAPKPFAGAHLHAPESSLPAPEARVRQDSVDWLPDGPPDSLSDTGGTVGRPAGAKLTPGALRIMALRAKLRQSNGSGRGGLLPHVPPASLAEPRHGSFKRASLSVLLLAGAALVASSTYYLYQTFVTPAPASPAMVAPTAALKEDTKAVRQ